MFRHHFHYIEDFIKKKNMGPNQIHGKIIAHIIKKKLLWKKLIIIFKKIISCFELHMLEHRLARYKANSQYISGYNPHLTSWFCGIELGLKPTFNTIYQENIFLWILKYLSLVNLLIFQKMSLIFKRFCFERWRTKLVKSFDEGLIPNFAETWGIKNIFNPKI